MKIREFQKFDFNRLLWTVKQITKHDLQSVVYIPQNICSKSLDKCYFVSFYVNKFHVKFQTDLGIGKGSSMNTNPNTEIQYKAGKYKQ